MKVLNISAVTLHVSEMKSSVEFYNKIPGLEMLYGGSEAKFTSYKLGKCFFNLEESTHVSSNWGRVILYCDDVDEVNRILKNNGLTPPSPRNASWGERFFHLHDPDGNEISFAQPLKI